MERTKGFSIRLEAAERKTVVEGMDMDFFTKVVAEMGLGGSEDGPDGFHHGGQLHLGQYPCLVLNADYQPLSFMPLSQWSWQEALKSVVAEKVSVLAYYNHSVRSARLSFKLPSVIALKQYVKQDHSKVSFTRRHLYLRDDYTCQYCGIAHPLKSLSFDHVVPKCRGGATSWENVVTCCRKCNAKKGRLHLNDLGKVGMRLLKKPTRPTIYELQHRARKYTSPERMHHTWTDFVQ